MAQGRRRRRLQYPESPLIPIIAFIVITAIVIAVGLYGWLTGRWELSP